MSDQSALTFFMQNARICNGELDEVISRDVKVSQRFAFVDDFGAVAFVYVL